MNNGNGDLKKNDDLEEKDEPYKTLSRCIATILILIVSSVVLVFVAKIIWTFSKWIWQLW